MTHALHLTTWHPYIDGVSGLFILQQCEALRNLGVDTGVVFSRVEGLSGLSVKRLPRGFPGFCRSDEPVRTIGFKSWNVPFGQRFVPWLNGSMLRNRYRAYAQEFGKPDVLHAHVALEAGHVARTIGQEVGLPYVVTEHSSEILLNKLSPDRIRMAQQTYSEAKAVIAVSAALAERIVEICPRANVSVIGNLVPEAVFRMRQPDAPPLVPIEIVSIGSLTTGKRFCNAIEALAQLPELHRQNINYTVIGDGPERNALERLAHVRGVNIDFTGNLAHGEAMQRLARAHIFLHPSAFETFGVVVAEALALGVPVVATKRAFLSLSMMWQRSATPS
jgi:L-malate glycosyltransferase